MHANALPMGHGMNSDNDDDKELEPAAGLRAEFLSWGLDKVADEGLARIKMAAASLRGDNPALRDLHELTRDCAVNIREPEQSEWEVFADDLRAKILYVTRNPKETLAENPISAQLLRVLGKHETCDVETVKRELKWRDSTAQGVLYLLESHGCVVTSDAGATYSLTAEGKVFAAQATEMLNDRGIA